MGNQELIERLNELEFEIQRFNITQVKSLVESLEPGTIPKALVKTAIDSQDYLILDLILSKIKPEIINSEIITSALETKNKDIITSIADNISDKSVYFENKKSLQDAILSKENITGLAGQILSRIDNVYLDSELQQVVIEMYSDIIQKHYNKGDLPSGFTLEPFMKSLQESMFFTASPNKINLESLNDKNRFLLLPVYSLGHAFCAYSKKLEEDKYSITFVNLGVKTSERAQGIGFYEEFVYSKNRAESILEILSFNPRIDFSRKAVDTEFAYRTMKFLSMEKYHVNVTSRPQKVGNCFTKNIEKAIRYALAIELSKTLDRNFDPTSLRANVNDNSRFIERNVKFLKPLFKPQTKINDSTTHKLKKDLIDWLKNRFPNYKNDLDKEWKMYESQKAKNSPASGLTI